MAAKPIVFSDSLTARRAELEAEFGEPITLDALTEHIAIFQRGRGHRHSTDDVLTAYYALVHAPEGVREYLDLGTGIGTVGLLVLAGLAAPVRAEVVEAQDISFRLLRENVTMNGLSEVITMHHGDLRDLHLERRFPLITGSPPYFPLGTGIVSDDSQKAHARFELRGDVSDYARAAKRHLAEGGRFVFCFPWAQKARALAAVRGEGFDVLEHRDVVPKEGLTPLFSVYACALRSNGLGGAGAPEVEGPPLVVRDAAGVHTDEMRSVRTRFGWWTG
ncbi:MAG: methyltransferase [Polyangiaceae bacterium]